MEYQVWWELLGGQASDEEIVDKIGKIRGQRPSTEEIGVRRRVYEFLAEQGTLHIVVSDALNFGHQASAATLAESLAELGYQKEFTFLAPANITDKITRVLSESLRGRMRVVQVPEFDGDKHYAEPVVPGGCGLVMIGADDRLDGEMSTSERFLDYLGADNVLILKPYAWEAGIRRRYQRGKDPVSLDAIPRDAVYRYHTKSPGDPLAGNLPPGLSAVLTAARADSVVLVPLYGLHRLDDPDRASVYATIVAAVRQAYSAKPVVLLEIGVTRVSYAPVPAGLTATLALDAGELPAKVAALKPGEVLAVTVDALDQDVFREVYRTGDGVRFLEGANTSNYVQLLGLPFLSPRIKDTPYPDIDGMSEAIEALNTATGALGKYTEWATDLGENDNFAALLSPVYTARDAMNSDLRIPRPDGVATLGATSFERLHKVKELDLASMFGERADKAIREYQAYAAKVLRGDTSEPPDLLLLEEHEVQALREALNGLIERYGGQIAEELRESEAEPASAQVVTVADVLRRASTEGDAVHTYFQRVRAQATDYRYDQVLQALNLFLGGTL